MKIEEKKYCYKYPRPAVTTDCVVFGFDGTKMSVLLVERGQEPFKKGNGHCPVDSLTWTKQLKKEPPESYMKRPA